MNNARSHAQAVWRTSQTQNILNPDGSIGKIEVCSASVDSIEGAIHAYHQEATADLQSEHAREIRRLNAELEFARCQNQGLHQIVQTNLTVIDRKDAELALLKEDPLCSAAVQLPEGHRIVTRASYRIPPRFHSIQSVQLTDRKPWRFWLPRTVKIYCTVEPKPAEPRK